MKVDLGVPECSFPARKANSPGADANKRHVAKQSTKAECTAVVRYAQKAGSLHRLRDLGPACQVDFVCFVCAARRHRLTTGSWPYMLFFKSVSFPQNRRDGATKNNRSEINVGIFFNGKFSCNVVACIVLTWPSCSAREI